ncbi:MAG: zinc ABC transporter substrate-binding protein [Thermoleophilia bacterium]|nr:zinc ABC transporter substrate-binding protein [Thermoleophilia bacterium]
MARLQNLRLVILPLVALAAVLVGCSGGPSTDPAATTVTGAGLRQIRIVAAASFWGSIASQIGGDRVAVTSLITDPSADPHLFESDAQSAAAIAQADMVIANGAGYDDFVNKLLGASSNPSRTVLSVAEVLGVSDSDANPHLWYDVPRIPLVAKAIEQALATKDPANAALFSENLARFEADLEPVLSAISDIRNTYSGAPVAYTERVSEYLLAAAGLAVKTPPGFATAVEEGYEPGPADTAAMEALITGHQVKLLLYNTQATSRTTQRVQDLAREAGIPVVGVTETPPPEYPTYQSWQLAQARAILQALGG